MTQSDNDFSLDFKSIDLTDFLERLTQLTTQNLSQIEALLNSYKTFTWENLIHPLEEMEDALEKFWSPLSHLHGVCDSPALRDTYQACLPKLSAYHCAIGQNERLFHAIQSINTETLHATQKKIIHDHILDFKLSGVFLPEKKKQRFEEISNRLSELSTQFRHHVLDSQQSFDLIIEDRQRLAGIPSHCLKHARKRAQEKKLKGFLLGIDSPSYLAIMTYAHDRSIRERIYEAYVTRASDLGPHDRIHDNTAIMNEILSLRHEQAQLLSFSNWAECSLATKMAESTAKVSEFLQDLVDRVKPQAIIEWQALKSFAKEKFDLEDIKPWDIAYLSDQAKQKIYQISEEKLRAYFPLTQVMTGLWEIIARLYGIRFHELPKEQLWHEDARLFELYDANNQKLGHLMIDLFSRPNKQGGAWMDSCQSRFKRSDGFIQTPIASLTCNFAKTSGTSDPLLTHDELTTLFHEMGHCLHHLLTKVDYLSAAGINGVEWDAVECPSQFFENWCWEFDALILLSAHHKTAKPLSKRLFNKMHAAKNFQAALQLMRQLEFALFDFLIHLAPEANPSDPIKPVLKNIRSQFNILPIAPYNRFQHSFSHIFAGGYAAGYYSYLWAEVLSCDVFARFKEEGIFNPQTGQDFLEAILEKGSSMKAIEAFIAFRGRAPKIDAFLIDRNIKEH